MARATGRLAVLLGLILSGACAEGDTTPVADTASGTPADTASVPSPAAKDSLSVVPDGEATLDAVAVAVGPPLLAPTVVDGVARVVTFGDVHGDLAATRDVLLLTGVIDLDDRWIADDTVVVQLGDQLDRGDDERAILDLFQRLAVEAHAEGGAFYALLGNHEIMNVAGDFRYVTPGGWADFSGVPHDPTDPSLADWDKTQRGRVAAFRPGGAFARRLADQPVILQVDDTVFVHGGVHDEVARGGIAKLNAAVRAWLLGEVAAPAIIHSEEGPVWSRRYSHETDASDCAELGRCGRALDRLGATRMMVAHTPQLQGVTTACDLAVWRVDVGLAAYYGGPTAAVEILGDEIYVLD